MRWENLSPDSEHGRADTALFGADAVTTRTFDTPEFRGITFHEIRARSIVNRVPGASRMPFEWTVNPYRGCSHACVYCFARKTHSYLDLDTGLGFDSQIVVKVNAPELLRHRLASRSWHGEHIAMGTNVDCYQRAEGRYRLMPGIIEALRDREPLLDPHQGHADPARPAPAAAGRRRDRRRRLGVGGLHRRAAVAHGRAGHPGARAAAGRGARVHRQPASAAGC